MGLSMGGTLVLRLAEERGDQVAGLVVVNASLATERKDAGWRRCSPACCRPCRASPATSASRARSSSPTPARRSRRSSSLQRAWPVVRADLARISCPVLVYRSRVDHVVEPVSGRVLLEGLAGGTVEERVLEDSYHVATLDHDAPTIFDGSLEFVRSHARDGRLT